MKLRHALVAGLLAATAMTAPATAGDITEDRIREIVREEIAKNPELMLQSIEKHMQERQQAEARAADQKVIDRKDDVVPAKDSNFAYIGNPEGTVEIVYFFDLNCGYCKRISPALEKIVEENPDVKVWHRDFPILAPSSQTASYAAGIVWEKWPDKYPEVYKALMGHQGTLTQDDIVKVLEDILGKENTEHVLGWIDDYEYGSPVRPVNNRVQESMAVGRIVGISGTPFIFIPQGDQILRGAPEDSYARLNTLVQNARKAISQ